MVGKCYVSHLGMNYPSTQWSAMRVLSAPHQLVLGLFPVLSDQPPRELTAFVQSTASFLNNGLQCKNSDSNKTFILNKERKSQMLRH